MSCAPNDQGLPLKGAPAQIHSLCSEASRRGKLISFKERRETRIRCAYTFCLQWLRYAACRINTPGMWNLKRNKCNSRRGLSVGDPPIDVVHGGASLPGYVIPRSEPRKTPVKQPTCLSGNARANKTNHVISLAEHTYEIKKETLTTARLTEAAKYRKPAHFCTNVKKGINQSRELLLSIRATAERYCEIYASITA